MTKKAGKNGAFGVFGRIKLISSWIKLLVDFVKMALPTLALARFLNNLTIFGTKMLTRLVLI
jgi:hypothetical protein